MASFSTHGRLGAKASSEDDLYASHPDPDPNPNPLGLREDVSAAGFGGLLSAGTWFLLTGSMPRKTALVASFLLGICSPIFIVAAAYTAKGSPIPPLGHSIAATLAMTAILQLIATISLAAGELSPTVCRGLAVGLVWSMIAIGGALPGMRFVGREDQAVITSCFVPAGGILAMAFVGGLALPTSDGFVLSHVTSRHRDDTVRFVAVGSAEEGGGATVIDDDLDGL